MIGFDILVTFVTAYYDNNHVLQRKLSQIARHYVRGWFVIDVCSVLPLDHMDGVPYNRLFRMLRLPRLYSLGKFLNTGVNANRRPDS